MKNGKRILSVVIKSQVDESPDTSHLGEYANKSISTFSIDRAHDLDCPCQTYNNYVSDNTICRNCDLSYGQHETIRFETIPQRKCFVASDMNDEGETFSPRFDCTCGNESDEWNHREYRYFNPSFNYIDKSGKPLGMSAEDVKKYTLQDYKRMESLNDGSWCYLGITAIAEVQLGSDIVQRITSGGLWGIESDCKDYIKEVSAEQLSELRSQLLAVGFSSRAIAKAFKDVKESE